MSNELIDRLRDLSSRAQRQLPNIATEEAAKNALVMPFMSALGYDVFNPDEVVPELVADVGMKKGEKVDYAIKKDGKIAILVECKCCGRDLKIENAAQLFRYFTVTDARFAILTNGTTYQFYTDIDAPNKMDAHPFFTFNLFDFDERHIEELRKFTKQAFDLDSILGSAATLKYSMRIKEVLAKELADPSEGFVRIFTSRIYDGRMTAAVREQFAPIVKSSFGEFIRERVSDRLKSALRVEDGGSLDPNTSGATARAEDVVTDQSEVETTAEELDAFAMIKAILRRHVSASRITLRDAKSYAAILLDDNNRKPLARLWFNLKSKRYVGLFENKLEVKVEIAEIDEIYALEDRLVKTLREYEPAS